MANSRELPNSTHFVLESQTDGWPGSGFEVRHTEMRTRRVNRQGTIEVQIELSIAEIKGSRMYRHHGEFTLTPAQADALVKALQEVR